MRKVFAFVFGVGLSLGAVAEIPCDPAEQCFAAYQKCLNNSPYPQICWPFYQHCLETADPNCL